MTIYLVCDCGKKLKARSECAGRRVMCTRCRRVWRLPGEDGAPLEAEPLPLDAAEDTTLPSGADSDDAEPRSPVGAWVAGGVAMALFVGLVIFLYSTFEGLSAARRSTDSCDPNDGSSTAIQTPFPARKPLAPPEDGAAEKQPEKARSVAELPPAERQATAPPPVVEKPPESLPPQTEIESVEPAEPVAEGSVVIKLRDKAPNGEQLKYEFRTSPKEPWQPVAEQCIKLAGLKPGVVTLEVRAVDPKGRETPILQRNLPVKPALVILSRLKEGDVFWQEVVVSRVSTFRILGADVTQDTRYGFVSSLRVEKRNPDGTFNIVQKIEAARLEKADPTLQSLLGDSLGKTKGTTFRITLGPAQQVLKFEGPPQPPQVFGGNAFVGSALLVWSFLDLDAWKEFAEHTFFLPDRTLKKDVKWSRKIAHSWGALGNWTGEIAYVAAGKQAKLQRINYTMNLAHQPPAAGAPPSGLPFKVGKSEFKAQAAGGAILFDPDKFRVTAADEHFRVRGQLALSILGSDTVLDMDEAQSFQLRVHEKNPLKK